jgi:hypothetical protein
LMVLNFAFATRFLDRGQIRNLLRWLLDVGGYPRNYVTALQARSSLSTFITIRTWSTIQSSGLILCVAR